MTACNDPAAFVEQNACNLGGSKMVTRTKFTLQFTAALTIAIVVAAPASDTTAVSNGTDGHIPADINYGFVVIGRDTLGGVSDENYTDVWSHNGYAYIGTFQEPDCDTSGVYVVDIEAAIANYPNVAGTTVAEIRSAPNTYVSDVKIHTVDGTDVLIATQEPCGIAIPGSLSDANAAGEGAPLRVGQGGISLYDVTDPTKPTALKQNFLEYGGVRNTFAWDYEGKSYLIGAARTFDFFDVIFVDITKPQSPKLLSTTGALDWVAQGLNLDQLETGTSPGIFNHDVWVDIIDGVPTAVVSYWDLGFVTLDVSDPANPVFLDDSTYPDPEPIIGQPYEGNASAAVFGSNGDYIFGGDEDFSTGPFGVTYGTTEYPAGEALFGPPSTDLTGILIWTGGEGCTTADIPVASTAGQVALMQRGTCTFQDMAINAEAQGYAGYVVANDAARGDALVNMPPTDARPVGIPGVFVGFSTGEIMKTAPGQTINADSIFDGWGYLHIVNNTGGDVTIPVGGMASGQTATIQQMGELGYYAPAQTVEEINPDTGEPYGTNFGDLTMHNIEADPLTQDRMPTFNQGPRMFVSWYSLGMRALEYRPGHFHANLNNEGSYAQNVHEVGRWIDPNGGSNFWGVHVDQMEIEGENTQVIVASDRNNGLYIFTFSCLTRAEISDDPTDVLYCDPSIAGP
jgi:hypothetical protein